KDIDVAYIDRTGGMDTRFAIQDFEGLVKVLDLNQQLVEIDYLRLNGSKSHVVFEKSNQIIVNEKDTPEDTIDTSTGSKIGWIVSANEIQMVNTDFVFRDDNEKRIPKGFDYFNIGINGLEVNLNELYYSSDSI